MFQVLQMKRMQFLQDFENYLALQTMSQQVAVLLCGKHIVNEMIGKRH